MARRRAAAPAAEAIEELDDLEEITDDAGEDDLEELVEEEPAPVPAKRTRAKVAPAKAPAKAATKTAAPPAERSEFDSNWLATHVTEETGIEYDGRAVRMLLRKLAKDGHLAREIGTDRSRYAFPKGANDPIVRQVIKLVNSGEAKAVAQEGLAEAKASAAKKAAPAKATKAAAATKAAPAKAATTRRRRTAVSE